MHVRWLGVAGVLVAGSFGVLGTSGSIEPAGAAAPIAGSTVPPAGWSAPDVVARCRAVVSTAHADYEAIVATARDAGGVLAIGMRADAAFPLATYEAKVCVWRDRDGDRQIDASEESTVAAFFGPLTWPAGARDAEVRASGQAAPVGTCARVWIEATYPDGGRSTKRTTVSCINEVPPSVVSEARYPIGLVVSGVAIVALVLARRERRGRPDQRAATSNPSYL